MWMSIVFDFESDLLVEGDDIVIDLSSIPGSRYQDPSLLVLRDEVEADVGLALPVHLGVHAETVLLVFSHVVLHDFGKAVLDLHAVFAF
jgi:hypothetical protein